MDGSESKMGERGVSSSSARYDASSIQVLEEGKRLENAPVCILGCWHQRVSPSGV